MIGKNMEIFLVILTLILSLSFACYIFFIGLFLFRFKQISMTSTDIENIEDKAVKALAIKDKITYIDKHLKPHGARPKEDFFHEGSFQLSKLIKNIPDKTLDIGTSYGDILRKFRRGVGIEISLPKLKIAKELTSGEGIDFVHASAEVLPFQDSSFELVIMSEILEHLPHPQVALTEAERVLSEAGILYIVLPNPYGHKLFGRLDRLNPFMYVHKLVAKWLPIPYPHKPFHELKLRGENETKIGQVIHRLYTPGELKHMLKIHGFKIVHWFPSEMLILEARKTMADNTSYQSIIKTRNNG